MDRAVDERALRQLLSHKRRLIDPEQYGFEPRPHGSGRPVKGVSQIQMDQLLSRAEGTYNRFEGGRLLDPELATAVARIFQLDDQERAAVWSYAFGQELPTPVAPFDTTRLEISHWQDAVDGISHMACVADESWDVLVANQQFGAMFPEGTPPRNLMEWMILAPAARQEVLIGWSQWWAPLLLPQLRAAYARHRHHPSLIALDKKVRADPVAGPLYLGIADGYVQPDGDRRPMWHAGRRSRGWMTVAVAFVAGAPDARLAMLMFRPDDQAGR